MSGDWRHSLFIATIFPEVTALAAILAAPPGTDGLLRAARHALGCRLAELADVADDVLDWAVLGELDVVDDRAVPRGRYLHCPDGSHMAMYDDQQVYFAGLVDFLRGLR
jgi:hypothetical protein